MITKQAGKIEGFFLFVIGIMVCAPAWKINLSKQAQPFIVETT